MNQEKLLDLFGIYEEVARAIYSSAMNLELDLATPEMQKDFNASYRSNVSCTSKNPPFRPKSKLNRRLHHSRKQPAPGSSERGMTEEEMYWHHLQAYLEDNTGDVYMVIWRSVKTWTLFLNILMNLM